MSSVLHPVGPEAPKTYWLRRAAVLVALAAIIALIVVLAVNLGGNDKTAVPPPTGATSAKPQTTPKPTSNSAKKPSAKPTSPKPAPTETKKPNSPAPTKAATPDCDPKDLRPTLTGRSRLKPAEKTTFNLSLINGGSSACVLTINPANFELKIYSGTDRIWSTADCGRLIKETKQTIGPEKAVEWQQTWDGKRSRSGCKTRPEIPRPGTYFATAQFRGAKPVQLGMTLR